MYIHLEGNNFCRALNLPYVCGNIGSMSVQQRLTEIDENWTKPFEQNCQLNKRDLKISSNWTIIISTVVTLNNLLIEQKRQLRTCQYWTNRSIEQLFFEQYPLEQLTIWTRPGDCCSNDICLVIPPWSKFPIVALLYIGVASYNGGQAPQTPLASWRCAPLRIPPGGAYCKIGPLGLDQLRLR